MKKRTSRVDRRLTAFDWDARRAAPVERLMDPHVHSDGDPRRLETLRTVMDRHRVEGVNLISPKGAGRAWLRRAATLGPIGTRVIPFYWLDLANPRASQVTRAYDLGFWGLKFIAPVTAYDDRFHEPLLARAEALGMPCLFHVGVLGGSRGSPGTGMSLMRADMLDTIAGRHPDLIVQGAHLGNPDVVTAFRATQYSPRLMWDASGGIRFLLRADPRFLHAAMHGLPNAWDVVMWATDTVTGVFSPEYADGWRDQYDYQLAFWQRILAGLPVTPSPEQLDRFFYGNAKRRHDEIRRRRKM
ncbi:MAG: amidohydrolase family protein [Planctomycetota bacterium]